MRLRFAFLLVFGSSMLPAGAQTAADARVAPACGPQNTVLSVEDRAPVASADATKATVVFIQDDGVEGKEQHFTTRIGLDGEWVGAYKRNGYFSLLVRPGTHHVCASVQSRFKTANKAITLAHFEAEAGKTYYFRTMFLAGVNTVTPTYSPLEMDRPDSDEAQFLMSLYPPVRLMPVQ